MLVPLALVLALVLLALKLAFVVLAVAAAELLSCLLHCALLAGYFRLSSSLLLPVLALEMALVWRWCGAGVVDCIGA